MGKKYQLLRGCQGNISKTVITDMKILFIKFFFFNYVRQLFDTSPKVKMLFAEKSSRLSANISKILRDVRKLFITKFAEMEMLNTFAVKKIRYL